MTCEDRFTDGTLLPPRRGRYTGASRVGTLAWLLVCLAGTMPVRAHKSSDSFLRIEVGNTGLTAEWEVAVRDLDLLLDLDSDGDGAITWGELRSRHEEVARLTVSQLRVVADGTPLPIEVREHLVSDRGDGGCAVVRWRAGWPPASRRLWLEYQFLFEIDPSHRGMATVRQRDATSVTVFTPERRTLEIKLAEPVAEGGFGRFFVEGVWHIWIGLDHVLFLLVLLLPAVLRRGDSGWTGVPAFREAAVETVRVVTAFTVGHSVTLGLAVTGLVALPSRPVETLIAISVAMAAVNNLRPFLHRRAWLFAGGFGLVHGFGFAGVMTELGLAGGSLLPPLAGFNLGVEAGQLAIVAVFLPAAFALRHSWAYRGLAFDGGSVAVLALATVWSLERAFAWRLLAF